MMDHQ